jgi:16S rRNA (guanine966-N2)-methyltransferase
VARADVSRIIAGTAGGRQIATPAGARTRPTTGRVREALFAALASWAGTAAGPAHRSLAGLAFCDLYAGSGAVGLEAASRGAQPVLLVEADRRTAQLAQQNVADLGLRAEVRIAPVEAVTARPAARPYDVVFVDPPYQQPSEAIAGVLAALVEHRWLAPRSLVVVERSRRTPPLGWPGPFGEVWERRYGETVLCFGMPGSLPLTHEEGVR